MLSDRKITISVIVAVFNGAKTLQQCINSFDMQTYQNKELIIIDGGSNDGTVDLLKVNSSKIKYWSSEPDGGIYNAWNKGLIHATGDWICFLGADDFFWGDQVLQNFARTLVALSENINIAYGEVMLLSKDDTPLYKVGYPWGQVKHLFTKSMSIPHPGLMHRNSLFKKNGNFDESFSIAGDYELLLRELMIGDAAFIPILVTGVRQGGISCNSGHSLIQLKEVRRAQIKHGLYTPSILWLLAVSRLLIRKTVWYLFGESKARKLLDLGRRITGHPEFWTKT